MKEKALSFAMGAGLGEGRVTLSTLGQPRYILFLNVSKSFWERVGFSENSRPVRGVFRNSL